MKKTAVVSVLLIALISGVLFASDPAVISYAEGTGFVLVSDGASAAFDIGADDVIGLPLKAGDTILTDDDSYVEIFLGAGNGGVIKIAESTTFTLMSLEADGGGVFKVAYGRIRVKVASLLGSSRIWITGHDTVAGVRGTDFGYDLFYDQTDDTSVKNSAVYVFEGEVDVVKYAKSTISKTDLMDTEPFLLASGKMVSTSSDKPEEKLRARNIDQNIIDFWASVPIITALADTPVVQVEDPLEVSGSLNLDDAARYQRDVEIGGKFAFATGVALMTTGALVKAFAPDVRGVPLGIFLVGAGATAGGTGMLIYSTTLD